MHGNYLYKICLSHQIVSSVLSRSLLQVHYTVFGIQHTINKYVLNYCACVCGRGANKVSFPVKKHFIATRGKKSQAGPTHTAVLIRNSMNIQYYFEVDKIIKNPSTDGIMHTQINCSSVSNQKNDWLINTLCNCCVFYQGKHYSDHISAHFYFHIPNGVFPKEGLGKHFTLSEFNSSDIQ